MVDFMLRLSHVILSDSEESLLSCLLSHVISIYASAMSFRAAARNPCCRVYHGKDRPTESRLSGSDRTLDVPPHLILSESRSLHAPLRTLP